MSLDKNAKSWEQLAKSSGGAGVSLGALQSPMGAAIAAGVALSPVLITLGTGLGGVALAAYGVLKPIEQAAQKTGGLQANMKSLDPTQQQVARSLLGLEKQYDAFQKALKPEVLGIFNTGLSIAGSVMHDVQPVAEATGKSFNAFLGQFGATLQDPEWKQFWAFMAQTAPQDMALVGKLVIDLTNDLPGLVRAMQPAAVAILTLADDLAKAGHAGGNFLNQLTTTQKQPPQGGGGFVGWLKGSYIETVRSAEEWTAKLVDWIPGLNHPMGDAARASGQLAPRLADVAGWAKLAGVNVQSLAQQVNSLATAESKSLDTQLAYSNALIAQNNDAVKLNTALKASGGWIGTATQKQRDSFSAANTYIADLSQTALQAIASGKGIGIQVANLQNALPVLEHAKSGSKAYWQEVRTLVGWLDQLKTIQQEGPLREAIVITGRGSWSAAAATHALGQGPGPFARGGLITAGTGPTSDDVLIRASKGEAVLPANLVNAWAPALRAAGIPGMAAGGLVGSYAGSPGGLQPWAQHDANAAVAQIANAIGAAMAAQFASALGGLTGAAVAGDAARSMALARSMFPWPGSMWAAYVDLEMREAGFNRFARNPSSGAYGIPQALPPTKMPLAAQAAGGSSAAAQLAWMYSYIASVYGNPVVADAHEQALHWYDKGGILPPGLSLAVNQTGRAESVLGSRAEKLLEQLVGLLDELCGLQAQNNGIAAHAPAVTGAVAAAAAGPVWAPSRASLGWGGR